MKLNLTKIKKCDEVWDDMLPCENGRICQSCNKIVIDFRELSDKAVAEIHMFSDVPVCGIYREDQLKLDKPTIPTHKNIPTKWFSLGLGLLSLVFPKNADGQKIVSTFPTVQLEYSTSFDDNKIAEEDSIPKQKYIVYGTLRDKRDDAVIGVGIYIKGTTSGVTSDLDGNYEIDVTEYLKDTNEIVLVYQYTGFMMIERKFSKGDNLEINLVFEEDKAMLQEADIIAFGVTTKPKPKKQTFWNKVKNGFKRRKE